MIVNATFKYDVPELNCQLLGFALVSTFQLRDIIFQCHTNYHASSVLPYDQLKKLKFFKSKNKI